ncbi:Multidrug resistance protein 3 [Nonomuraea coxensis DSM 45129]|uniref:Multidrug resistance protein 3 n=1 Tax=Nonomuraea coxensis DSM 45129 TaxID=1122611 RepID=A0ABX8TWY0_9ACTN|nr:MFS transporter [Nonomuraea coxensis]QYC39800.1 Multidrug resistance protein 3 [Nonomuraea coxensis DSM 45129]
MGLVVTGLILAMLLAALDQTIMAPALPVVAGDLGGLDQMPGVVTAYLVAATVVMPVYGKLGDRYGRKPTLQVAVVVFVTGAVLCALATSMPQLMAFRVVQGLGGGGLMIGAQAAIGELVSPRERGRFLGYFGSAYVVAAVGGPLIGGFLIDRVSWRWIFALYPPLGLLALVLLTVALRLPRPEGGRRPLDVAGALALAALVVGVVLAGQTREPVYLLVAGGGLAGWLVSARYAADPILPLRLFRERAFAVPVAISLVIGFALFGTITYMPAYLQIAHRAGATQAGLLVTALMGGVLASTIVSGRLITRTGRYKPFPVAGTAVAAAGLALVGLTAGSPPALAASMLVTGLGVGLVMQVMLLAAQNAVPYGDLGTATSSVTFVRQIGASAGVAVVGAFITLRSGISATETPAALPDGVREAFATAVPPVFGAMAPLLAVAFGLALALPARPLRTTAHADDIPVKENT